MNPYFLPYSQWTPRMLSSRFPVTRLNRNGIPSLRTISVTTDTTGSAVVYNICPWRWKQLCNEGLMILRISQVPATGSTAFVVSINPKSRRKLVDIFISCNGESKKLSVPAERSIINDTSIGLTVATNKEEIANMVRQNYNEFKAKKEAASKYDEEMEKCKDILDQLEAQVEIPTVTNTVDNSKEINDLKNDVADIRKMIEDTKKMFMSGFPKPPMPPMPNVPAPMK